MYMAFFTKLHRWLHFEERVSNKKDQSRCFETLNCLLNFHARSHILVALSLFLYSLTKFQCEVKKKTCVKFFYSLV